MPGRGFKQHRRPHAAGNQETAARLFGFDGGYPDNLTTRQRPNMAKPGYGVFHLA